MAITITVKDLQDFLRIDDDTGLQTHINSAKEVIQNIAGKSVADMNSESSKEAWLKTASYLYNSKDWPGENHKKAVLSEVSLLLQSDIDIDKTLSLPRGAE